MYYVELLAIVYNTCNLRKSVKRKRKSYIFVIDLEKAELLLKTLLESPNKYNDSNKPVELWQIESLLCEP